MYTAIFKLIVSTCAFAIIVQAHTSSYQKIQGRVAPQTFTASHNHELELKSGERDFLLPGEGFVNKPTTTNRSAQFSSSTVISTGFPAESIVEYKSFTFGTTFTLRAFSGKYVSYLMADTMIGGNGLSRDEIRELVDLTDVLYAHMAEIVGAEPSGDGLLTIALLNPGRDFGGRGWVGSKGVEMYEGYALTYRKDFLAGCAPNPVVHELAHNFDIYNAYISHDGNNYHAWTAFLIPYVQYYSQTGASWGGRVVRPATLLDQTITSYMDEWDAAGATASWAECVKTGSDCEAKNIYSNEIWGGVVLRFARLHGASQVKRIFNFLGEYKNSHPTPPATAEAKNDVLVSAFAAGARSNIQCELAVWRWPVSSESAANMSLRFPGPDPPCNDTDNDGYTPVRNDLDDFNAAIHPGAIDTPNGIDDDCDSIIDDTILRETNDYPSDSNSAPFVSIPAHIIGHTATADDTDSYRIEITTVRSINIWAQGMGGRFSGWFELRYADDPSSTAPTYANASHPTGSVVPFDRAGTWILTVRPWAGNDEGYELFLSEIQSQQLPLIRVLSTSPDLIVANVSADENWFAGAEPTEVRLWAEGHGFIAQQTFQTVTIFKWSNSELFVRSENIRLRAQFLAGDSPASSATKSVAVGANKKAFANIVKTFNARIALRPTPGKGAVSSSPLRAKSKAIVLQTTRIGSRHRRDKELVE